jgi:hypothetical protein
MQLPEHIQVEAFRPATFVEFLEKFSELFMSLFILRMSRAAVPLHAFLLILEMRLRVGLQKINQVDQEFDLLPRHIVIRQHAFQMIRVVNQHPVLEINGAGTDDELVTPDYHSKD